MSMSHWESTTHITGRGIRSSLRGIGLKGADSYIATSLSAFPMEIWSGRRRRVNRSGGDQVRLSPDTNVAIGSLGNAFPRTSLIA